jgi:hypothetical protein
MVPSESAPQLLSNEWSCRYIPPILKFWGNFCVTPVTEVTVSPYSVNSGKRIIWTLFKYLNIESRGQTSVLHTSPICNVGGNQRKGGFEPGTSEVTGARCYYLPSIEWVIIRLSLIERCPDICSLRLTAVQMSRPMSLMNFTVLFSSSADPQRFPARVAPMGQVKSLSVLQSDSFAG